MRINHLTVIPIYPIIGANYPILINLNYWSRDYEPNGTHPHHRKGI